MDQQLLAWLLEAENPSVRYRAMLGLLDDPGGQSVLREARDAVQHHPKVRRLLEAQKPGGYWIGPDYYLPKHTSTFWTLTVLGDLGLTKENEHVQKGCEFMFEHQRPEGSFCRKMRRLRQGIVWEEIPEPCTHARIVRFLIQFGYKDDPRLRKAIDWLLQTQRKDGMWRCTRPGLGCLRATIDCLRAAALDEELTAQPATARAAQVVLDLLLEPNMGRYHVGEEWRALSYPYFGYGLIPALEALTLLGYAQPGPQINRAIDYLLSRRLPDGRWPLDLAQRKPPLNFGRAGEGNKWITLDCWLILKRLDVLA